MIIAATGHRPNKLGGYNQKVYNCDELIALWNGSPGGTKNCIDYAHKQGKKVITLWPTWKKQ